MIVSRVGGQLVQLYLFPIADDEKSDDDLIKELAAFGWRKVNYWSNTKIYQIKKPGILTNARRSGLINLLEKERLRDAGDFAGYLNHPPPNGFYNY